MRLHPIQRLPGKPAPHQSASRTASPKGEALFSSLGSQDTIAPAVSKGNETLLNAINDEIKALGEENFFHKDYEATLVDTYGTDYESSLVVEGGVTSAN